MAQGIELLLPLIVILVCHLLLEGEGVSRSQSSLLCPPRAGTTCSNETDAINAYVANHRQYERPWFWPLDCDTILRKEEGHGSRPRLGRGLTPSGKVVVGDSFFDTSMKLEIPLAIKRVAPKKFLLDKWELHWLHILAGELYPVLYMLKTCMQRYILRNDGCSSFLSSDIDINVVPVACTFTYMPGGSRLPWYRGIPRLYGACVHSTKHSSQPSMSLAVSRAPGIADTSALLAYNVSNELNIYEHQVVSPWTSFWRGKSHSLAHWKRTMDETAIKPYVQPYSF